MSSLLKGLCRTKAANNGLKTLQIASSDDPPDLILLTSLSNVEDEQKGFEPGGIAP